MDKNFWDGLFSSIDSLPIEQVIGKKITLKRSGAYYDGLCPFHADRKTGSFKVNPQLGIWTCFTCGKDNYSGRGLKFYLRWLEDVEHRANVTYKDAALELAMDFHLINSDEYQQYSGKNYTGTFAVPKIIDSSKRKELPRPVRAEKDFCHIAYESLQKVCGITPAHKKILMEDRHLSADRIEKDYFSIPSSYKDKDVIISSLIRKLLTDKLPAAIKTEEQLCDKLIHVPGFCYSKQYNKIMLFASGGIGILIRDASGLAVGVQVRKDKITVDPETQTKSKRYVWASSDRAFYDDNFKGGCGPGTPLDILYPENPTGILTLTEGRFKSECLLKYGSVAISVQGVGNWRGITDSIDTICIKLYQEKKITIQEMFFFFDTDLLSNHQLIVQLRKIYEAVKASFPSIMIRYAIWSRDYGKGIDDLINSGNIAKAKYCDEPLMVFQCVDQLYRMELFRFGVISENDLNVEQKGRFISELQSICEQQILNWNLKSCI